jgi:hypothetical protein
VSLARGSGYANLLSDLVVPVANGLIQNSVPGYNYLVYFTFFEPYIVIYLRKRNQQNSHFLH